MASTVEQIQMILRSDPDLTPDVADALGELMQVAYNQFVNKLDEVPAADDPGTLTQ